MVESCVDVCMKVRGKFLPADGGSMRAVSDGQVDGRFSQRMGQQAGYGAVKWGRSIYVLWLCVNILCLWYICNFLCHR